MSNTLSKVALNRALLARQMLLLPPARVGVVEVIERLAGLQAQQARPPFIGLWSRIAGFERKDLVDLLQRREVIRATLMRGTLHLMSARDYPWARLAMQPALTAGMHAILRERAADLEIDKLVKAATKVFGKKPCTFAELRPLLSEAFNGLDERAMGYAVRMHLPLITVPCEERWAFTGDSPFELAPKVAEAKPAQESLARRYLAAFGPATPADFQSWSALKNGKELFADQKDLVTFRDEKKRELFDLADAPRPDESTPPPAPRFVAPFDNLILAHVDRSRIIAEEHRSRVVTKNLLVLPTFLVDGFVAGTWQTAVAKKTATLTVSPFSKLTAKVKKQLEEQATALVRFTDPEAAGYAVQFAELT
jgi:hypothetical protein